MRQREQALSEIAARETNAYLQSRAKIHLDAAIASVLHRFSIAETAKMLRDHADHLEQFG